MHFVFAHRFLSSVSSRTVSTCTLLTRDLVMSAPPLQAPRRFAPLKESSDNAHEGAPKLKGVVFDVDGTLCLPQTYMFVEMRSLLGISKGTDILAHIETLSAAEQETAMQGIRDIEQRAMASQLPQPGLEKLMAYLESKGLPKGICTRNFDTPVNHLLSKFLVGQKFGPIVTRDFKPPKPDPAGILHIAKEWGFADGRDLIMVGDSVDDMTAGYRAGAATVLLVNDVNAHLVKHEHTDLCISRLDELIGILENGFVGQIGKGEEHADTQSRAEKVLKQGKAEEGSTG